MCVIINDQDTPVYKFAGFVKTKVTQNSQPIDLVFVNESEETELQSAVLGLYPNYSLLDPDVHIINDDQ